MNLRLFAFATLITFTLPVAKADEPKPAAPLDMTRAAELKAFAFAGRSAATIAASACSRNACAASIAIFINASGSAPIPSTAR